MSDGIEEDRGPDPPERDEPEEEHSTQGTMVLTLFYLVVTIGIWGSVFILLLQRG